MIQKKKFSDAIAANISVVGELLSVFRNNGAIEADADFNTIKNWGIYATKGTPSNIENGPQGLQGQRGTVFITGPLNNRSMQIIITEKAEIATRFDYGTYWSEWNVRLNP